MDQDKNHQQHPLRDQAEQDTDVHQDDDEHLAKDPIAEATSTQPEQLQYFFLPTTSLYQLKR